MLTNKQTNKKKDRQTESIAVPLAMHVHADNLYQAKAYCHHRQQREGLEMLTEPGTPCILNTLFLDLKVAVALCHLIIILSLHHPI